MENDGRERLSKTDKYAMGKIPTVMIIEVKAEPTSSTEEMFSDYWIPEKLAKSYRAPLRALARA